MVWLLIALLALLLALYVYTCHWPKYPIDADAWPWLKRRQNGEGTPDSWADELLSQMTLKEKVAQLSGDGGALFLVRLGINVLLLGRFPNTYAGRNSRLQIPPFSFSDGPRGVVIGQATCFPVAMARAASWDVALERRVGDAIGKEVRASGANYFGGLCINLLRHPAWGRAQECYGEDPHLMGEFGVALLQAVQQHNVMACAKHFAVNSIENSRFYIDVKVDERTLQEVYFPHFKRCVDAGVASIMSAYNQLNGEYCGHSEYLLNDVLREQWGFEGFVTSDWLWGVRHPVKPVVAGMDVEMPYNKYLGGKLHSALKQGEVDEALIERNTRRVLRTKLDFISRTDPQDYSEHLLACDEHRHLAREVAEQSMVLLKNEQLLPLDVTREQTIAFIGELAVVENLGDHGSSRVSPPEVVTLLAGLQRYVEDQASGTRIIFHDGKNVAEANRVAMDADITLLVVGYRHDDEGENLASNQKPPGQGKQKVAIGGDRSSLSLHETEEVLIRQTAEVSPNTIVAMIGGSAIVTSEWDTNVEAILMAWYPGMEGGNAFARILFGDVNPSGRLPFSVPHKADDLVPFSAFAESIDYGYYHGYTHLDKTAVEPAYAFGHGLGYTQFDYMMLSIDGDEIAVGDVLTVGVQLKNSGERAGSEVVQLYIGFDEVVQSNGIERPEKLLRGFRKVSLEAGEDTVLSFEISAEDLQRYDSEQKAWVNDIGKYTVMVGSSSRREELLCETFSLVKSPLS